MVGILRLCTQWDRHGHPKECYRTDPDPWALLPSFPGAPRVVQKGTFAKATLDEPRTVSRLLPELDGAVGSSKGHSERCDAYFGQVKKYLQFAVYCRYGRAHSPHASSPQPTALGTAPGSLGACKYTRLYVCGGRRQGKKVGGPCARGTLSGRGWASQARQRPRARAPFEQKDPCAVPSMASTPPLWSSGPTPAFRVTGRPALPGAPLAVLPHQMLTWVLAGARGQGWVGVRTLHYPTVSTAQHGTGAGTLYLLLRLWPYQIQYGAHRPKPSALQTRKTPRRLYQPRGPPIHLIPADSPFALMFPSHSCDIHCG